jgi:dihydroorotase
MAKFDTILKNGIVVSYSSKTNTMIEEKTNIGLSKGVFADLNVSSSAEATEVIDITGLHLLPGIIDSQVHFREPGMTHKEDLESGTRAALLGGITSIFEMPNTIPSTTTKEYFNDKLNLARGRAHCNYAFFIGASSDNYQNLNQLEKMDHCSGIKIFLGSSFGHLLIDDDLLFEEILKNGTRRVIIHSEDEKRLRERKQLATEAAHPRAHPLWRDEESAYISTYKSIQLAKKYQRLIHILHVSSKEEMELLAQHKDIATVEILPQYLTFSSPECYEKWGNLAQQNPPIRDQRHMDYLWTAVNNGTVDVIGSDHAPHTWEEKQKNYPHSPSGMPGVQTLVPSMLNHVHHQKLSLKKFVQLTTENPRKVFNIKNKGRIEIGYDADLTIVDLKKIKVVEKNWLASKSNWSLFEGMSLTGWPEIVFLNGVKTLDQGLIIKPLQGKPVFFNQ